MSSTASWLASYNISILNIVFNIMELKSSTFVTFCDLKISGLISIGAPGEFILKYSEYAFFNEFSSSNFP